MKDASLCLSVLASLLLTSSALAGDQRATLTRQLIPAVYAHNAVRVEMLLRHGADPNIIDSQTNFTKIGLLMPQTLSQPDFAPPKQPQDRVTHSPGATVLMIAASQGDMAIVRSLLDHGANPAKLGTSMANNKVAGSTPSSPLWEAISGGKIAVALLLIKRGVPVNGRFDYNLTPLLNARNPNLIAALVSHGADINASDDEGNTALLAAVRRSDIASARLLLNRGARPNAQDRYGQTALMRASLIPRNPKPILNLLLRHDARVNARDKQGATALNYAAVAANIDAIKLLLFHGANANAQDKAGVTALMSVSYDRSWMGSSHWKVARRMMQRLLRRCGANPRLKDKEGCTSAEYEKEDDPGRPAS